MPATLAFPQVALAPAALLAGPVHLQRTQGALSLRAGGSYGHPPSTMRASGGDNGNLVEQPPIGEVVGAGAVGVLAGHLVFQSLLISVGLGATVMGVAATSADGAGQIARSSGRMAVAAFDRTAMFNRRFQVTERLLEGARVTGYRLKEFDEEHAVVHRATEGAKKAWLGFKQYDEAHGLTERAGGALASGLDTLTEFLTPPPPNTRPRGKRTTASSNSNTTTSSSSSSKNNNNNSPKNSQSHRRSDTKSSRRHGAAARGGEEVGGWAWWREGLVKREAGRGRQRPGGAAAGDGKRWVWRADLGGVGRGAEAGQKQHQRSQQRQREEEWSRSWRVLGEDEEL